MKTYFIVFIFILFSSNSFGCLTFEPGSNGKKSRALIKHFHESFDVERSFVLLNENNDFDCKFEIQAAELLQKSNGAYQFLNSIPGLKARS